MDSGLLIAAGSGLLWEGSKGLLCGVISGLLCGVISGLLCRVASGLLCGVTSGLLWRVTSDFLTGAREAGWLPVPLFDGRDDSLLLSGTLVRPLPLFILSGTDWTSL